MNLNRLTDRTGVVHIVESSAGGVAHTTCERAYAISRGGTRVWQVSRGHHHEICIVCLRRATEGAPSPALREKEDGAPAGVG